MLLYQKTAKAGVGRAPKFCCQIESRGDTGTDHARLAEPSFIKGCIEISRTVEYSHDFDFIRPYEVECEVIRKSSHAYDSYTVEPRVLRRVLRAQEWLSGQRGKRLVCSVEKSIGRADTVAANENGQFNNVRSGPRLYPQLVRHVRLLR